MVGPGWSCSRHHRASRSTLKPPDLVIGLETYWAYKHAWRGAGYYYRKGDHVPVTKAGSTSLANALSLVAAWETWFIPRPQPIDLVIATNPAHWELDVHYPEDFGQPTFPTNILLLMQNTTHGKNSQRTCQSQFGRGTMDSSSVKEKLGANMGGSRNIEKHRPFLVCHFWKVTLQEPLCLVGFVNFLESAPEVGQKPPAEICILGKTRKLKFCQDLVFEDCLWRLSTVAQGILQGNRVDWPAALQAPSVVTLQ